MFLSVSFSRDIKEKKYGFRQQLILEKWADDVKAKGACLFVTRD